jgi:hypothetical protein
MVVVQIVQILVLIRYVQIVTHHRIIEDIAIIITAMTLILDHLFLVLLVLVPGQTLVLLLILALIQI